MNIDIMVARFGLRPFQVAGVKPNLQRVTCNARSAQRLK